MGFIWGFVINYYVIRKYHIRMNRKRKKNVIELREWLLGKRYLIDIDSTQMTEKFEKEHSWEISRNYIINQTIKKIDEIFEEV